ncbi:hypothetical protein [uncultured Psychroserpens sp.]|uniref:hypothetical protein n=1 Tax=uncultured Psychroserpens sp. TaxID=255436 RepID=UPI00261D81D5|nr:hypothetical protein [uncultured Psychroserpens sp.]
MKKIIYKNEYEAIIKEIELPVDEYYSEPNDIQGKYKTREIYKNEKLNEYIIFNESNKSRIEILNNVGLQEVKFVLGQREFIGEFRHEKLYHYNSDKILETIVNSVYDCENNVIVSSFTDDIENEIPYWNGTSKYYYDKSIRVGDSLFECHFNDNGELIPITIDVEELGLGDHDGTWIYNDADGIEDLMRIFNMPKFLAEFYVSSEIIPNKNVS